MDTNDPDTNEDIQQVPSATPDFKTELAKKLQDLAPEVIADGKVDVKKLKELLDDDATDDSERFGLFWPGKKRAMRAAQEPTTATLKPAKEESKDWDTTQNIFIEGDNLEVLKLLQKHYHNKIKMIYIDPPYNTGKDFVYPDNYKEGLQSYLEFTKQVDEGVKKVGTNTDTDGRYHSNWLNMMYPRLKLARNLLTDDGVIFISIDDNEQSDLRKLCDEVFAEDNFVCQFVWHSSTGGGLRSKYTNVSHQYILCYVRDDSKSDMFWAPLSEEAIQQYKQKDEKGLYRDKDFAWKNSSAGVNQKYPITAPDGEIILPKHGYIYRFIKERFDAELKNGSVTFKKSTTGPFLKQDGTQASWNIYIKKYLSDGKGAPTSLLPRSLVGINNEGTTEVQNLFGNRFFENPKNVRLLDYLLAIGTTKDSVVLDFFAGSGSTAHAVMELNRKDGGVRKYIQVQLPEPTDEKSEAYKAGYKTIADIAKERIRRAGEKIKVDYADKLKEQETPLDVGFKVYKLADSNFSKWHTSSGEDVDSVQQRLLDMRESSNDNATQEDLLTEILLKLGLSLTAKATQKQISDLPVWDVNGGTILAYLDEHTKPNLDQLRAIADTEPAKFVILEDAFQGDDELKTNLSQICKTNKIDLWTV